MLSPYRSSPSTIRSPRCSPTLKLETRILRPRAVGLRHGLLELDRGGERIGSAAEFRQSAITGELGQPAAMPRERRLELLGSARFQARQRTALVPAHQGGE